MGPGHAVNSHDLVPTLLHLVLFVVFFFNISSFFTLLYFFRCSFLFFLVWDNHHHRLIVLLVMTSSPTPDISSLSLSSQPSHPHQRLYDNYDYDGSGDVRQYHYATAPPVPPGQPPFNPLSMNQPLKNNKTARAALPTVRLLFPPSPHFFFAYSVIIHFTMFIIFF